MLYPYHKVADYKSKYKSKICDKFYIYIIHNSLLHDYSKSGEEK